ncbi:MAG: hypothetical protein ACR2LU_03680 [Luteitalea sp.]
MIEPIPAADRPAWRFVAGGVLAAALAVAGNLSWRAAFPSITGYVVPDVIGTIPVILSSVLSVLLAAGIYLLLARGLTIATPLYVVGCLAVAAASCVVAFMPAMPDGTAPPAGFPLLTIPMHLLAGLMAAAVVPLVVVTGRRR